MHCKPSRREVTPVTMVHKPRLKLKPNQSPNLKKKLKLHQNKSSNSNNSPSQLKNSQKNRRKNQSLRKYKPHLSSNRSTLLVMESTF